MHQFLSHFDPVTIASFLAAAFLAVTRLATTAKPLWNRLPDWLQGALPALVLVLPQLAEKAAGVTTTLDLVNLLVLAGALILPGFHSHTVELKRPNGPGSGAAVGLVFVLAFGAGLACSPFRSVDWPKTAACGESLEQPLVESVAKVLGGSGDVESELGELVKSGAAADAVVCAVKQIVSDLGSRPMAAPGDHRLARGRAFLSKVEQ